MFSFVTAASVPEPVCLLSQQSAWCPGEQYCWTSACGLFIPGDAAPAVRCLLGTVQWRTAFSGVTSVAIKQRS